MENELRTLKLWTFHILAVLCGAIISFPNVIFLLFAYNETRRRNEMMATLSSSLELDFFKKDARTVRLPTINFLDPETLLSWIEARKIILDTGARFQIRIQIYISFFMVMIAIMSCMILAMAGGLIRQEIMTDQAWIFLTIYTLSFALIILGTLLPAAYINK